LVGLGGLSEFQQSIAIPFGRIGRSLRIPAIHRDTIDNGRPVSTSDKFHHIPAGVFLPCNVLLQQHDEDDIEVSAVDPVASMSAVDNPELFEVAGEVQNMIKRVIESLSKAD